jgi:FlaA1/EpsC-like NDP-sugar epimerase
MKRLKAILRPTPWKRLFFFLVLDIAIVIFSLYLSFLLRFGFAFPPKFRAIFFFWLAGITILNVFLLAINKLYIMSWRYCGLSELFKLFGVFSLSLILLSIFNFVLRSRQFGFDIPYGVILMTTLLSFSLVTILRFAKCIYGQVLKKRNPGLRALIIGANFSTKPLVRELLDDKGNQFWPLAIVDDDPQRIGTTISGIKVAGAIDRIGEMIHKFGIEVLLITLPRAERQKIAFIFETAKKMGIKLIKVIPKIEDCDSSAYLVKEFRNIDIEDLLCRPEIKVDFGDLRKFFADQVVLVSGAAGTIGSEIVRKLILFGVKKIVAYEIDETETFNQDQEIHQEFPGRATCFCPVVGDIRDEAKLKRVIGQYKPDLIFHAAACKHVPLMEDFPEEAIKTNIFGTKNLAELAVASGVKKFINISTDKAVNPVSIMGASKRAAEIICRGMDKGKSNFISVRFGNVLGSRGSVIPLFINQIRRGGPLTVTHPDMSRYFMATSEAVLLVLQAAYMGRGGEVFVLDMGQPVRILDLAEKMIRLNGLEPYRDMGIVFIGIRPGEKVFEELLTAEEGTDPTRHSHIFCARNGTARNEKEIRLFLQELEECIADKAKINEILGAFLPFYKGKQNSRGLPSPLSG